MLQQEVSFEFFRNHTLLFAELQELEFLGIVSEDISDLERLDQSYHWQPQRVQRLELAIRALIGSGRMGPRFLNASLML